MTATALTAWPAHAAGPELAAQLTARWIDGHGWEVTNAPARLYAPVHALVWFAEHLGCELICPPGAHEAATGKACRGHMPFNPQPGDRIIVGTRGVGSRVVYRVTAQRVDGSGVILIEDGA